MEDAFLLIS